MRRYFLDKGVWTNIVIFLIGSLLICIGIYIGNRWANRADIKAYNEAVRNYNAPPGLRPATEERPTEFPIERATAYFQKAVTISKDTRIKSLALYNLGTLIGREGYAVSELAEPPPISLQQGITMLAEAVRIDPYNEDAKYNLELLEKVITKEGQEQGAPGAGYSPGAIEKSY
jgi:hypothetical protein